MIELDQGGATHGHRELVRPPTDLVPVIEYAWIERGHGETSPAHRAWRIVPDVSGHLIYSHGRARSRLRMVGARSRWTDIDVTARDVTVGLRFRPGAATRGLGLNAQELTDRSTAFEQLRPRELLSERLDAASDDRGRLTLMFDAVREWSWNQPADWRSRAALALAHGGQTRVADMAWQMQVSSRTLHDVMRREVGLGPKQAARIVRLARAMRAASASTQPAWRTVATANGFADQAHLIRESQALLGESPARFVGRARFSFRRFVQCSRAAPIENGADNGLFIPPCTMR